MLGLAHPSHEQQSPRRVSPTESRGRRVTAQTTTPEPLQQPAIDPDRGCGWWRPVSRVNRRGPEQRLPRGDRANATRGRNLIMRDRHPVREPDAKGRAARAAVRRPPRPPARRHDNAPAGRRRVVDTSNYFTVRGVGARACADYPSGGSRVVSTLSSTGESHGPADSNA